MYFVYIIYSAKVDQYYVGESDDVSGRLEKHNSAYYTGSFTKQADDWQIRLEIPCGDRRKALVIEKGIKSRKSRKYVENLIKYPELVKKLIEKYS